MEFGELTTVMDTNDIIMELEIDLQDRRHIIFATKFDIWIVPDREWVNPKIDPIIDPLTYGNFSDIIGFVQVNESCLIVAERHPACLRTMDRDIDKVSTFAGKCRTVGFADGMDPRFGRIDAVIEDVKFSGYLLVADGVNNSLRRVNSITGDTMTVDYKRPHIPVTFIAYDWAGENLLLLHSTYISVWNFNMSMEEDLFTGSRCRSGTNSTGKITEAEYNEPTDLVYLSPAVILVADRGNNRLRIIDTEIKLMVSICEIDRSMDIYSRVPYCPMKQPNRLLVVNNLIYIGGAEGVRKIQCEYNINNLTLTCKAVDETSRLKSLPWERDSITNTFAIFSLLVH